MKPTYVHGTLDIILFNEEFTITIKSALRSSEQKKR